MLGTKKQQAETQGWYLIGDIGSRVKPRYAEIRMNRETVAVNETPPDITDAEVLKVAEKKHDGDFFAWREELEAYNSDRKRLIELRKERDAIESLEVEGDLAMALGEIADLERNIVISHRTALNSRDIILKRCRETRDELHGSQTPNREEQRKEAARKLHEAILALGPLIDDFNRSRQTHLNVAQYQFNASAIEAIEPIPTETPATLDHAGA